MIADAILVLGLATLAGLLLGRVFTRFKVPVVAAYVIAGVLLGKSVSGILGEGILDEILLLTSLALGFVAFEIGGELHINTIRRLGKSIIVISICEALGAFVLVTLCMYLMTKEIHIALVLGAIASATAPAATMMVVNQYKARGPLTTTLVSVVAIDDAIALMLYGFSSSIAKVFMLEGASKSLLSACWPPFKEIVGAAVLGLCAGILLTCWTKRLKARDELLILSVGMILLTSGCARLLHLDLLLANMALGATFCNCDFMVQSTRCFDMVKQLTPPLYNMFFVLAGTRLDITLIPAIGLLGLVYTLVRIAGKIAGASFGGMISSAESVVKKYLGFGLLSQIGVAVGLAMIIYQDFDPALYGAAANKLAGLVINILLATTVITEIAGPLLTRYALIKAGEAKMR
ncbi:MAG: cation:proton antiporter [bacterium]